MFHHWEDEEKEIKEKKDFIKQKSKELHNSASMLMGRHRDFEKEAEKLWKQKVKSEE